jgi:hypothetical protein
MEYNKKVYIILYGVKSFINEQCHGKGRCHIITSNVTIGVVDPCPRKSKVLTIRYRCMAHTG